MKNGIACLVFAIFVSVSVVGQTYQYKNLVLEGGGVKGFAFVGAMEVLDSMGILQQIEKIGGSSAGAIQGTLLAIGYTPAEILKTVDDVPLRSFNDGFLLGGLSRMKNKLGFFKGKKIYNWIEDLIAAKTGDGNITFMQLHQQAKEKGYKDIYITGTDLTYRCLRIFSYETYPDMMVKDALRISLSIPLYFEPVRIDDRGKVVKDKKEINTHLMVDGGLISNYPIHIFDSTYQKDGEILSRTNRQTLGIILDSPAQVDNTKQHKGNFPMSISNLNEYLTAVYQTIIDKPNPDVKDAYRTITVSHNNMSGRVRKLSDKAIGQLIENGRNGVRTFFAY